MGGWTDERTDEREGGWEGGREGGRAGGRTSGRADEREGGREGGRMRIIITLDKWFISYHHPPSVLCPVTGPSALLHHLLAA